MAEKTRAEKMVEKLAANKTELDAAKSQACVAAVNKLAAIDNIAKGLAAEAAVAAEDAKKQKLSELDAQLEEAARCVAAIKANGGKVPSEYVSYE